MTRTGKMHAANLENSPRRQRVLAFLRRNGPVTTLEISQACTVCAVNSAIDELRANGFTINCQAVKGSRGVYQYELQEAAQLPLFRGI